MKKFYFLLKSAEDSKLLQCIRSGLVMAMPFLLIGSMALVFKSFPFASYQSFIATFYDGIILYLFNAVYNATFGLLSLFLTATISINYARIFIAPQKFSYGTLFASLIGYGIFCGVGTADFSLDSLGPHGMFLAIASALIGSFLYERFSNVLRRNLHVFTDGADSEFTIALNMVVPILLSGLIFALTDFIVLELFNSSNIYALLIQVISGLFINIENSFSAGLLFVFMSNLLWFFGIHGSDVLDSVHPHLFSANMEVNQALIAQGKAPTEIVTKTFIDIFVGMGGCGVTICLLVAILIFYRKNSSHFLAKMSILPMIFNINEMLVFGFPIVFNPYLAVPFILTPLVVMVTSYLAMYLGLVPYVVNTVEWTTPILISGFVSTGSIAGVLLQLFNIALGVVIYMPFIKMYEDRKIQSGKKRMDELVNILKVSEEEGEFISLTALPSISGTIARSLSNDLKLLLEKQKPTMYYQPQFDNKGNCIGVEALLRWKHPLYGMIYPPLVIKIASESHQLSKLELAIFEQVAIETPKILEMTGAPDCKISINVSATTMNKVLIEEMLAPFKKHNVDPSNICIEITEQVALHVNQENLLKMQKMRAMGWTFAIDDFSMGSTSLKYLQNHLFDYVKLDGSLVKDMMHNERSERIIASLIALAKELSFSIIAEFVETNEQRDRLENLECNIYQGYLFSPAVTLNELNVGDCIEKAKHIQEVDSEKID